MLAWSSFLQLRATLASSEVTGIEAQMGARTNEFRQILDNQKKTVEIDDKLRVLRQLAASRFLYGTLLNALQQTTVEDAQLIRVRVDQTYARVEGTKSQTIVPLSSCTVFRTFAGLISLISVARLPTTRLPNQCILEPV